LEQLEKEEVEKIAKFGLRDLDEQARKTKRNQRLLRLKELAVNIPRLLWNLAVWPLRRFQVKYVKYPRLLNLGEIMQLLGNVLAQEIFIDGCFNTDPHPGNVLLLPDGRLGLLDYGQCKRIDIVTRVLMSKFMVAVANSDQLAALQALQDLGNKTKSNNSEVSWRLASFWFDRNDAEITKGMNMQEFLDWCQHTDPPVESSDEIVMIGRVSMLLRGLGNAFGLDLRVARMWESRARQLLRSQAVEFQPRPSKAF